MHVPCKSCMQDSCTILQESSLHDLASSFLLGRFSACNHTEPRAFPHADSRVRVGRGAPVSKMRIASASAAVSIKSQLAPSVSRQRVPHSKKI